MKLKDWRLSQGLTQEQLSDRLSAGGEIVPQQYISRWESGVRPGPKYLRQITDFTNGAVTANDFYAVEADGGEAA